MQIAMGQRIAQAKQTDDRRTVEEALDAVHPGVGVRAVLAPAALQGFVEFT